MSNKEIVQRTKAFVKKSLEHAEGGHDWSHILRVYRSSLRIAEGEKVDHLVVSLGALLHDIADSKFHNGDEEIGPAKAKEFLETLPVQDNAKDHVVNIIRHISYKNSLDKAEAGFNSRELEVVRDADRLDAIGAIGIARTFNYGGFRNRPLYDPENPPKPGLSKEEYKKNNSPTINHFYEKLLLLKDQMHTPTAKKLAEERHQFMLEYLRQFYREWDGDI
ncbi:HD domain-containing protein [Poritiphilus flavus]|uniref:HD domain-containing protein n=1 Tax=Poritiphilus flavus TaxID=2697053 RepID=A0A6L9E8Q8_9FLAO|nr:HD domain-containing protein [Poritiphilus flavus]NAS10839.1 HD domain-containing protein [Poritiphilus flavus]